MAFSAPAIRGRQDQDGYVIITGRIKELINKGGEKISPVELDNVVAQNQAVAEAVSFAIDDEMYGQDVGLAVVLKEGKNMSEDDLRNYIISKVAKFKVPKKVKIHTQVLDRYNAYTPVDILHRRHAQDSDGKGPAKNGCTSHAQAASA